MAEGGNEPLTPIHLNPDGGGWEWAPHTSTFESNAQLGQLLDEIKSFDPETFRSCVYAAPFVIVLNVFFFFCNSTLNKL